MVVARNNLGMVKNNSWGLSPSAYVHFMWFKMGGTRGSAVNSCFIQKWYATRKDWKKVSILWSHIQFACHACGFEGLGYIWVVFGYTIERKILLSSVCDAYSREEGRAPVPYKIILADTDWKSNNISLLEKPNVLLKRRLQSEFPTSSYQQAFHQVTCILGLFASSSTSSMRPRELSQARARWTVSSSSKLLSGNLSRSWFKRLICWYLIDLI